ncbi:hypothetical protein DFH08DRAFT_1052729 [Mycena albidolilacea]|uniref:Uncharacterized protein n=1 Tax=Mycena albidolilacea TaxID=1033008 RepID=A0AAD7AD57_9AGAR|nr:hypothetical protein DFH08DRAFT_1052729 [Mycena albidolilacea]
MSRFEEVGEQTDLKKGIDYYRDALTICGPGALISIGHGLFRSFSSTSSVAELDEGIGYYREVVSILPDGHRHQLHKFEFLGQRRDLEEALDLARRNLASRRPGDASRPSAFALSASILIQRFHYFMISIVDDLSQALDFRQETLELCPAGHLKCSSYTFDLASAMLTVYTWLFRDPEHLEAAILNHTLALSLRPQGHSDQAVSLQGLAAAYSARFKHFGRIDDLEAANSPLREAPSLCRAARHFTRLNDLALDLTTRFDQTGEIADIEETIALFTEAKGSIPPTVSAQSRLDLHLAIVCLRQHDVQPNSGTLATGFRFFEAGFYHPSTKPWTAPTRWWNGPRLHVAYSRALEMMDQTVAMTPTADMQHQAFAAAPDGLRAIAMEAAAVAIADGQLESAVELLEQGRAILWTRMRGYRPSLDRLHDTDDAPAMRFEKVSKQLEVLAVSPSEAPGDNTERWLDFDAKMKTMRVLQEEREEMPVPFKALPEAARGGPIIMVNEEGSPTFVPLPGLTLEGLRELNEQFLIRQRLPTARRGTTVAEHCAGAAGSTAAGDEGTPDEAIHLAAAMQFAGFRSVVGTLREMADQDGPFVAREFYGHVFREGSTSADFTDAAVALHGAVRALRKKDPQSVSRWIDEDFVSV